MRDTMRDAGFPSLSELALAGDERDLGEKARWLARGLALGLPIPMGFALDAGAVKRLGEGADADRLQAALAELAVAEGLSPRAWEEGQLIVSVRASSADAPAGQLPTILDVGAQGAGLVALEARLGSRERALDARLRFLRGIERAMGRTQRGGRASVARLAGSVTVERLEREVEELEALVGLSGATRDDELRAAMRALAVHETPVVVQAMRFGSSSAGASGAGTATSRHPITGERVVFGEIAWERQGEDLSLGTSGGVSLRREAAGRRGDESLEARLPAVYAELAELLGAIERRLEGIVEFEFAIEAGRLAILQVREATLSPRAEMRTLVDRVEEGAISRERALLELRLESVVKVGRVELADRAEGSSGALLGRGLAASPGAATGVVVLEPDEACERAARGEAVVLVRSDANPEDAPAIRAAVAVVTASGGLTSHAAVMSRALGRPCVVSVSNLSIQGHELRVEGGASGPMRVGQGEVVTVDGTLGRLFRGALPVRVHVDDDAPRILAAWAREVAPARILVEAPGDLPGETPGETPAEVVDSLGADGVARGEPRWEGLAHPVPDAEAIVVEPRLVPAARVALAQRRLLRARPLEENRGG